MTREALELLDELREHLLDVDQESDRLPATSRVRGPLRAAISSAFEATSALRDVLLPRRREGP